VHHAHGRGGSLQGVIAVARRLWPVVFAFAAVIGLALAASSGLDRDGLLSLAPALLLLSTLFARRYPGERLILRFAGRRRARRSNSVRRGASPSRAAVRVPRGGLLMGFALAVRPPPLARIAS
jgi:hypothetical protein